MESERSAAVIEVLVEAAIVDLTFEFPNDLKDTLWSGQIVVVKTPKSRGRAFGKSNQATIHFSIINCHSINPAPPQ